MKHQEWRTFCQKTRLSWNLVMNMAVTCLLAMWQTLHRRHDFYLGLFAERRKPYVDVKGKVQAIKCRAITNVA